MTTLPSWALITNDRAGWGTMRRRWEADLQGEPGCVLHLEDYAPAWGKVTQRLGFRSTWHLACGREASNAARQKGCRLQLFSTLHYAAWLPRCCARAARRAATAGVRWNAPVVHSAAHWPGSRATSGCATGTREPHLHHMAS